MYWLSFAKWSSAHGAVFTQLRLNCQGEWTPIVYVRRRYPWRSFWRGVWPVAVKEVEEVEEPVPLYVELSLPMENWERKPYSPTGED